MFILKSPRHLGIRLYAETTNRQTIYIGNKGIAIFFRANRVGDCSQIKISESILPVSLF